MSLSRFHIGVDPLEEAREWLSHQGPFERDVYVLGLGMGYHVLELMKSVPELDTLAVIEADEELFRMSIGGEAMSAVIKDPRVHFFPGMQINHIAERLSKQTLPFSRHIYLPSFCLEEDYYTAVSAEMESALFRIRTGRDGAVAEGIKLLLDEIQS